MEAIDIIKEARFVINSLLNHLEGKYVREDVYHRSVEVLHEMDSYVSTNLSPSAYRDWHHAAAEEIDDDI